MLAAVALDGGTMKAASARRAAARVTCRRERRGNLPGLGRVHGLVLGMLMALLGPAVRYREFGVVGGRTGRGASSSAA
jgi:hypothetical protein